MFDSWWLDHSALAQLEEHTAVNRGVLGSKPRGGDYVFLNDYPSFKKASVAKWLRRLFSKEEIRAFEPHQMQTGWRSGLACRAHNPKVRCSTHLPVS